MRATTFLAAVAAALALLLPATATATEAIVPPGNSAAAQYTEAFPTAAGERDTDREQKKRSPQKVLGEQKSKQLESKGAEGKAVADLVAETSPAPDSTVAVEPEGSGASKGDGAGSNKKGSSAGEGGNGGNQSGGGGPAGGNSQGGPGGGSGTSVAVVKVDPGPSGSSGVGEVVGQATGASSGELGLFLPLILLGGLLWAVLFAWRRRQGERVA